MSKSTIDPNALLEHKSSGKLVSDLVTKAVSDSHSLKVSLCDAAIACSLHAHLHGDIRPAQRLVNELASLVRRESICEYFQHKAKIISSYETETDGIVFKANKAGLCDDILSNKEHAPVLEAIMAFDLAPVAKGSSDKHYDYHTMILAQLKQLATKVLNRSGETDICMPVAGLLRKGIFEIEEGNISEGDFVGMLGTVATKAEKANSLDASRYEEIQEWMARGTTESAEPTGVEVNAASGELVAVG